MSTRKFWPLDYDPEGEIYENLAWDLPGLRPRDRTRKGMRAPKSTEKARAAIAKR